MATVWKREYQENRLRSLEKDPVALAAYKSKRSRTPEENKAYMRQYYANNKAKFQKRRKDLRHVRNAKRRQRYADDAEYRAKHIRKVAEYYERNPDTRLSIQLRKYGLTNV
jgi:hypothetical protein